MREFATLVVELGVTSGTQRKVDLLRRYLAAAPEEERLVAVALLSGRRPERVMSSGELREAVARYAELPLWLIEESYQVVGDLADCCALLLSQKRNEGGGVGERLSLRSLVTTLADVKRTSLAERISWLHQQWRVLSHTELFLLHKLITGGFRIGVSRGLVVRALAEVLSCSVAETEERLLIVTDPLLATWEDLEKGGEAATLFPFYLASPLDQPLEDLGDRTEWIIEYKWDGIRVQGSHEERGVFLWSRGEELISQQFPEIVEVLRRLPVGTRIDGELLAETRGSVGTFADLQKRINLKRVTPKVQREMPVMLRAYDLLKLQGADIRREPLEERRRKLEALLASGPVSFSDEIAARSWDEVRAARAGARTVGAEGLMLKRRDGVYGSGRTKSGWIKWKVDPYSVDAVLVYAQKGHGRRANLYSDYTFAVRAGEELVTFAKAYSGLTEAELVEVDRFVRAHTKEKFGPVRTVTPALVFEIGFEVIQPSGRHKSGVAVRFPRILRWRRDKPLAEIDTVDSLRAALEDSRRRR